MTTIEWTDETWNPTRGCSRVSPGCEHCYAERQAHRQSGPGGAYEGLTIAGKHGPRWTGKIRLVPEALDAPLRWRKPRRVFVDSMSDLFHEDVPDEFIAQVFDVMERATHHTFQLLTKRPERMRDWVTIIGNQSGRSAAPPNVWIGVSCETQQTAEERIPVLLQTPAAVKFVSVEPLLGPVLFKRPEWIANYLEGLHWVIVGGESGPHARPCNVAWIRSIVEQCEAADVPVFCKQLGAKPYTSREITNRHGEPFLSRVALRMRDRKGSDPSEWPGDLRVRQWPEGR